MHKWRPYLLGRPFIIKTNQQSLKYILEQRIPTPAQQKWLTKLLGYLFMVENKQGCENKVADALSRRSDFGFEDFAVSNTFVVSPCLCLISFPSPSCLCLISFPFQVLGFHLVHDSPLGGHSSFLKSFHRLKQDFFRVGMKSDLELHIR